VGVLIRRWREAPAPVPAVASVAGSSAVGAPGATPDEMARLEAAIRDDRR
jgi:hypothetical protein